MITHKRSFEEVIGHENLICRAKIVALHRSSPDLEGAVEGGNKNCEHRACDGFGDNGTTATLYPVEAEDDEFSCWCPEHHREDHRRFEEDCSEQKIQHIDQI